MPTFPDGSKFKITKTDGSMIEVDGFDGLGGNIGSEAKLNNVSTLSDTEEKYAKSNRKDGGERDITFQLDAEDPGQKEVMAACDAGEERVCQVIVPDGPTWSATIVFAGYTISEPEKDNPLSLIVKCAVNKDGGIS